ncbi:uncharacterized protein LOC126278815 [Schistocerca gregaria]|uniref:uncharacterized protein LOC126278815 n=1 Tax=Schistocerca gregaria TaxID=7010 RepID=UPI00211E81E6|nr:uncharacterized protein LOC126278815 [Schistocerca gregaria]
MSELSRHGGPGAPQRPYSVHGCHPPAATASRSLDELARLRCSYDRSLRLGVGLGLGLGVYSDSNICDSCRGAIRPQPWYHQHSFFFSSSSISSLRHPDGASNPDLNLKEELERDDEEPPPELPPPLAPAASWRLWAQQRPPVVGEAAAPPAGAAGAASASASGSASAPAAPAGGRVARVVPRTKATLDADAMSVLQYCREDVARLERRWTEVRASQVRELRQQQAGLRRELADAKARLLLPTSRWGYDLHVEESMDPRAPGFVEALQRETEILRKRVAACKSRVLMATCFDCHTPTPPLPPWTRPPR